MFEAGKYYRHTSILTTIVYKIHEVRGRDCLVTWKDTVGTFNREEIYNWINAASSFSGYTECNANGGPVSPEPEADAFVEAAQHAVVYMAYTQSRNTNTVTIISHVDEERFNAMLRAQEGQGFRTLAKKKIKFTI